MSILKTTLHSADITILGHFNPAILRHEFLTQSCEFDFSSPVKSSPPEIAVVSEIQYDQVRWFMDFERMVVQNFRIQSPEDFTAPRLAEKYLSVLPHTPIFAAGFNILADFQLSDPEIFWDNLRRGDRVYSVIDRLGGDSVETILRVALSAGGGRLLENTLIYNSPTQGRLQVACTRSEIKEVARCKLNFEVRGLEDRSKFSPFVGRANTVLDGFIDLIMAFSERI